MDIEGHRQAEMTDARKNGPGANRLTARTGIAGGRPDGGWFFSATGNAVAKGDGGKRVRGYEYGCWRFDYRDWQKYAIANATFDRLQRRE